MILLVNGAVSAPKIFMLETFFSAIFVNDNVSLLFKVSFKEVLGDRSGVNQRLERYQG